MQENAGLVLSSLPLAVAAAVLQNLVGYLGRALIALLQEDSIAAFNLLAIHRLADDVAALAQVCDRELGSLPALQVGMSLAAFLQSGVDHSAALGRRLAQLERAPVCSSHAHLLYR